MRIGEKIYRLLKCLPGQRIAASQWFQMFANGCKEFGVNQDPMQPTLFMNHGEILLTVHVDDVFTIGKEPVLCSLSTSSRTSKDGKWRKRVHSRK